MHLHPPTPILPLLLLLPLLTTAQTTTTTSSPATTSITLIPFSSLPTCATSCGPLYDAQGSCTPPGSAVSNLQTYEQCFCAYGTLQSFYTESNGVCPNACAADSNGAEELVEIQSWFTGFCKTATATGTATSSGSSASSTGGSSGSGGGSSAGQTWFHTHWKWVVMLIILFIGITSIWLSAFLIRRHHHAKREREIEMRPPVALGPHQLQSMTGGLGYTDGVVDVGGKKGVSAVMAAKEKGVYGGGGEDLEKEGGRKEKEKGRKKWIVKERT